MMDDATITRVAKAICCPHGCWRDYSRAESRCHADAFRDLARTATAALRTRAETAEVERDALKAGAVEVDRITAEMARVEALAARADEQIAASDALYDEALPRFEAAVQDIAQLRAALEQSESELDAARAELATRADAEWVPASEAAQRVWMMTFREGENEVSVAAMRKWPDGEADEWIAPDGRTTVTHHSYAPPTHFLRVRPPTIPAGSADEQEGRGC